MKQPKRKLSGNSGIQFSNWAQQIFKDVSNQLFDMDHLYEKYKEFAKSNSIPVLRMKVFRKYLEIYFRESNLKIKPAKFELTSKIFANN